MSKVKTHNFQFINLSFLLKKNNKDAMTRGGNCLLFASYSHTGHTYGQKVKGQGHGAIKYAGNSALWAELGVQYSTSNAMI